MVPLPALNPTGSSAIISSTWGLSVLKMTFSMAFTCMADEADGSVVLAELQVAFFRECINQRLSPWGRPFSYFPDLVTDLSDPLWSPRLLEQIKLVYYQLLQTSPFLMQLLRSQLPHGGLAVDLLGADCSLEQ